MKKDFNTFISTLSETNATLDYYVDFEKTQHNISKIKIKLNQLNYLLGQSDLDSAIRETFTENPKCFSVLGILIATRKNDKKKIINDCGETVLLEDYFNCPDKIIEFIHATGLGKVFQNKQITNLVDYVFGIEVGLDTNARKNRGGKQMEKTIANLLRKHHISFREQVKHTEFPHLTALGEDVKQFDFVIKTNNKTYLIEANFYNTGGSKLNEVARAYSDIAPKINQYPEFEFVWVTDGQGWLSAKNKLEEAYNNIPLVFNLHSLQKIIHLVKSQ